jgi:Ca2+-binding EF-hand superfamily protein
MISFDDFYKCLKSLDHKATKIDTQNIIAQYTKKNPSNIERETFNKIMHHYIQK